MRFAVAVVAIALVCLIGRAHAQFAPHMNGEPALDPRVVGAGTTDIPIKGPATTEVLGAEAAATSTSSARIALEEPIDPTTYVCGAGDTFDLNFWGQQNFRLRIAADLEGRLFISKVGFLPVAGKTLSEVRTAVTKKVRANYPGLRFDLVLVSPRSFSVHVAGNVARPGMYSASPVERASALLARAGGSTGSRRRISLKRTSGATLIADLVLYEFTGDAAFNPLVLDGDVIFVPFADVVATIGGAVRRPGAYELVRTKDLSELLDLAGGLTSAAVRTLPIRLVRRSTQQVEVLTELSYSHDGVAPNAPLENDDHVYIRTSEEVQRSVQLIGAVVGADPLDTATSLKRLPYIEGDTVLSLIERAGGIKAPGDLTRSYISRPQPKGAPILVPLDLEALLIRRDFAADKPVMMGDLIVVPRMQYGVRVEGAVTRAGLYPYRPEFGIAEYVATAGGRTRSARDIDEARLIQANGQTRSYSKNEKPAPGDAIIVPERDFTRPEIVQIALSAAGLVLSAVAITFATTR